MPIFKRVEVWVLLVLVCAGIVAVFLTRPRPQEDDVADSPGRREQVARSFTVQRAEIHPEGPLELDVLFRNSGPEALELSPPTARVLNEAGGELQPFFLAFAPPPVAPAGEETELTLRYRWSEEDGRELTLVIQEEEAEISVARPAAETAGAPAS